MHGTMHRGSIRRSTILIHPLPVAVTVSKVAVARTCLTAMYAAVEPTTLRPLAGPAARFVQALARLLAPLSYCCPQPDRHQLPRPRPGYGGRPRAPTGFRQHEMVSEFEHCERANYNVRPIGWGDPFFPRIIRCESVRYRVSPSST